MKQHSEKAHSSKSPKECVYCRTTFVSEEIFSEQMLVRHGMPDYTTRATMGPTQFNLQLVES